MTFESGKKVSHNYFPPKIFPIVREFHAPSFYARWIVFRDKNTVLLCCYFFWHEIDEITAAN